MAAIPEPQVLSSACTPAEWETRCEQAALYRILDHYGMSDLANQVVGARVKDAPNHYLLYQYGMFYEEITASSLIKTDAEGKPLDPSMPAPVDGAQNLAKWIFGTRPEINYFIPGHC
jgi:ribulose-5-phosphate 4-epimerase/fuculose-1-phosphate aldolase